MGQPITLAKRMILGPAATWRYYAGHAGKVAGESYPPDEDGMYKIVQYEPLGESVCWLPLRNLEPDASFF
jgi:aldehyde dehydrogenase (NAD+)